MFFFGGTNVYSTKVKATTSSVSAATVHVGKLKNEKWEKLANMKILSKN